MRGLDNESGGLRVQRVPPTERKGRVHTSTVTVAVIDLDIAIDKNFSAISEKDFKIEWYSGTGAGGQYRNKHQNSIKLTHIPTNITKTAQCRSRQNSYNEAMKSLLETLHKLGTGGNHAKIAANRKEQVGSGMRGDKRATLRFQDDTAHDHLTGKRTTVSRFMKGFVDDLWVQ